MGKEEGREVEGVMKRGKGRIFSLLFHFTTPTTDRSGQDQSQQERTECHYLRTPFASFSGTHEGAGLELSPQCGMLVLSVTA